LVIQPTLLPSCKASSCPTSTEGSQVTQSMDKHPKPDQTHQEHHTLCKMMLIPSIYV
jgi:hypothetical protein